MADYQLTDDPTQVLRTADSRYVTDPGDGSSPSWNAYQTWLAEPNTPDPAPIPSLGQYKFKAIEVLHDEFEEVATRVVAMPNATAMIWQMTSMFEGQMGDNVGNPTASTYPLVDQHRAHNTTGPYSTMTGAAEALANTYNGFVSEVGEIEAERNRVWELIRDATDYAEVDAAMAGRQWPVIGMP